MMACSARVLPVEYPQRIGRKASSRVVIQRRFMPLEIGDQFIAVREAVVAIAE